VLEISAWHDRLLFRRFVLSVYKMFKKNTTFLSQSFTHYRSDSNANSILYIFGWSSLYNIRPKSLTQKYVRRFPLRMVVLIFLYIKYIKRTQFALAKLWKHHLCDFIADSILYKFGASAVHNIRLNALTQEICPRDFCVALPFLDRQFLFFRIYNSKSAE
jgi:hypothetical protein